MRIGYCQRGENLATTLRSGSFATGRPDGQAENEYLRDQAWFRNMWLSNADLDRLLEAALTASADNWPAPAISVSGVSNNRGMAWNIDEAAKWIGYRPEDNVWDALAKAGVA